MSDDSADQDVVHSPPADNVAPPRFPMGYLFMAVALNSSDRANMSVTSVALEEEFGWSKTKLGAANGAYLVGYFISQFVAGPIADSLGKDFLLITSVFGWSFFTVLTAPSAGFSFSLLYGVRVAMGFAEGFCFPVIHSMVSTRCDERSKSFAISFLMSGSYFGSVVTNLSAPFLVRVAG